jgi:hypothetical protein
MMMPALAMQLLVPLVWPLHPPLGGRETSIDINTAGSKEIVGSAVGNDDIGRFNGIC